MATADPSSRPSRSSGSSRSSRSSTQNTVLIAVFAALVAALGLVPPITVGVVGVPITLQTLGVMLAGALLGPVRGLLAIVVVEVLVLAGLPLLAGGRGGIGVLASASGGYFLGWLPGAFVVGLLVAHWALRRTSVPARYAAVFVSCVLGGIVVVYALGVPWSSVVAGLRFDVALLGSLVFVPGDLAKAVVATVVAVAIHRSYRSLLTGP